MRIDITGFPDTPTLNRARHQLDAAGISYAEVPHPITLVCENDDLAKLRHFVDVALRDPDAKVYRKPGTVY